MTGTAHLQSKTGGRTLGVVEDGKISKRMLSLSFISFEVKLVLSWFEGCKVGVIVVAGCDIESVKQVLVCARS